ncbi:CTL-like protein 2 [Copidosoma floridanum]|uniref:CTL-like protein 2 n=1 Tax=Copidosoma floridanum TaxID=29053 RepID=UPI0006C9678C|nr:CTL-like protein 2 [Copidosoma floridanum]
MSEVIQEACRAVLQFPLLIPLAILSSVLLCMVLGFGCGVFALLVTNLQFPSFFLILCLCLHIYGTIWLFLVIFSFSQMVFYGTISTWFWTEDKSAISNNSILRNLASTFRYMGTAAYGSPVGFIFPVMIEFIKNFVRQTYKLRHNVFIMIPCWLNILMSLRGISVGVTPTYSQGFKRSVDRVCPMLFRYPLRFYSINMALFCCAKILVLICGLIAGTSISIIGILEYKSNALLVAIPTAMILSFFVALTVIAVLNAAITTIFRCILEDFEKYQENENRTCFMKPSILHLMMDPNKH